MKPLTKAGRDARVIPAKDHGEDARRRLHAACSMVSAKTSICVVYELRGRPCGDEDCYCAKGEHDDQ
jgi:hypothetical protein